LLPADGTHHIAGLGNVRQIDLGPDFIAIGARGASGTACGLRFARSRTKMSPHLLRFVLLDGTGVRLFLGDPDFQQDVKDRLALDLQFSGQIVNSNLAHPPFPASTISR